MKPSDLFEGEDSTLAKTFREATMKSTDQLTDLPAEKVGKLGEEVEKITQVVQDNCYIEDGKVAMMGEGKRQASILISNLLHSHKAKIREEMGMWLVAIVKAIEELKTYSRIVGNKRKEFVSKKDVLSLLSEDKE